MKLTKLFECDGFSTRNMVTENSHFLISPVLAYLVFLRQPSNDLGLGKDRKTCIYLLMRTREGIMTRQIKVYVRLKSYMISK